MGLPASSHNEAAERLRREFRHYPRWPHEWLESTLDEALATARRATVERIRDEIELMPWRGAAPPILEIRRILDEEAAR